MEDLAGVGKVVKSIPKKSIEKIVDVTTETFQKAIAPIIETSDGLGRLIKVKFDSLVDIQKVYAVDALMSAKEKLEKTNIKTKAIPKANIIMISLENASNETNNDLRNIWSNLIANELLTGNVHPEFPNILKRLSSQDAQTLNKITEENQSALIKEAIHRLINSFTLTSEIFSFTNESYQDFSHEHLYRLGLIKQSNAELWKLTKMGEEFLKSVTDPSLYEEYNKSLDDE